MGIGGDSFIAINPNGTRKWYFNTSSAILSDPAIDSEGIIYFGCHNGHVYAMNPDGTLKWDATGKYLFCSPVIGLNGELYIGNYDQYLYAFAPVNLSLTSPTGGESWTAGTVHDITWTSSGIAKVKIEYSSDNGSTWKVIADSTAAAAGSYSWAVPRTISEKCLVKISNPANTEVFDK